MPLICLDSCLLICLAEQVPVFSDQVVEAILREPAARAGLGLARNILSLAD